MAGDWLVPISNDLLEDGGQPIADLIAAELGRMFHSPLLEDWLHGIRHTNRNFMPTFVPFPRLKRVEDRIRRFAGRLSDALEAFRYGILEPEDY